MNIKKQYILSAIGGSLTGLLFLLLLVSDKATSLSLLTSHYIVPLVIFIALVYTSRNLKLLEIISLSLLMLFFSLAVSFSLIRLWFTNLEQWQRGLGTGLIYIVNAYVHLHIVVVIILNVIVKLIRNKFKAKTN